MKNRLARRVALVVAASLAACTTYGRHEITAMSNYEICAAQMNHAWGLSDATRHLLVNELSRRQENCAAHEPAIRAERDEDLYDRMYRNQSP